ncbi:MAG: GWxTD domain-containing protein [Gemmatimonadota bacterium]
MAFLGSLALAATVVFASPKTPAPSAIDGVKVHAVRFYDSHSGLTQVRAFIQIPLEALSASSEDEQGMITYQVSIHLQDSLGATLSQDAWPEQHVPAVMRGPGVTTVNSFDFVLRPGKYRLEVTVQDSMTGKTLQAAADLVGYAEAPTASDLVLSPGMRALSADSTPRGTEWRNGSLLVTSAAELILSPTQTKAFYLLEAYSAQPDSGNMSVRIRDSTGSVLVVSPPVKVRVGAGGGVLRGQLDMEGLPPGRYNLEVNVELSSQKIERSGAFVMADPTPALQRRAAELAEFSSTDSGYFGAMDEASLDRAYEPLSYLANSGELRAYRGATIAAKRRFLVDFWEKRDPDHGGRDAIREQFYGKVAYADSTFRELGSRTQSGWKTDRGRVYARLGAPDEKLDRVRAGQSPSYLVWHYTRGKNLYYIFSDRSGLGAYKLLSSNDLAEAGAPDWRDILGPDALRDVGLFLNLDFFSNMTNNR